MRRSRLSSIAGRALAAALLVALPFLSSEPARAGGLLGGLGGGGTAAPARYGPKVVIRQVAGSSATSLLNAVGSLGWKVTWKYSPSSLWVIEPTGLLSAPLSWVLQLLTIVPGVAAVEKEILFTVDDPYGGKQSQAPAFSDDLNQASMRSQPAMATIEAGGPTGGGMAPMVAVIDGGFDLTHEALPASSIAGTYDSIEGDTNPNDEGNGLDDDGNGSVDSGVGHGTAVAALVLAVAPAARILAIRALDDEGIATVASLASAVDYAMRAGAQVINISAGAPERSMILENVLAAARSRGIAIVAAAGNGSGGPVCYPASSPNAVAVAGVAPEGSVDPMTSVGSEVDASAPSVEIVAPFPGTHAGYGRWHGTSFAAPLFAGAAAQVLMARPGSTAPYSAQTLLSTVTPYSPTVSQSYGSTMGAGILDVRRGLSR